MGCVDLVARDRGHFHRLYARKRLREELRDDETFRRMFLEEARIAGLLRDSHVVSVLDYGEDADGPFLIMDFVEGLSCAEIIRHCSRSSTLVPLSVCVRIAHDSLRGLHAAHELHSADTNEPLSLIHRDVSPQNILVGFDGIARVTDFGIARAATRPGDDTTKGVLKGKLGYMSPEQLRFEELDRRTDLFSFGVTLYELVTGTRLYRRETDRATARAILTEPAPDLGWERGGIPPALVAFVMRLLAKDPAARFDSAGAAADELKSIERTLIDSEDHVEPATYLVKNFAQMRRERSEQIQRALKHARSDNVRVAASAIRSRRRRWLAAVAVAIVTASFAMVTVWSRSAHEVAATQRKQPPPPDSSLGSTSPRSLDSNIITHPTIEGIPPGTAQGAPPMAGNAPDSTVRSPPAEPPPTVRTHRRTRTRHRTTPALAPSMEATMQDAASMREFWSIE